MLRYLILPILLQVLYFHTFLLAKKDKFNKVFNWQPYTSALESPSSLPKPVLLLFYGENCFASSRFRKEMMNSEELVELSESFTMVKIERGADPGVRRYRKEGTYYPRVFFLGTNGALLQGINGPEAEHRFYFATAGELVSAMRRVLEISLLQDGKELFDIYHEDF